MFEQLSNRLQSVFDGLGRVGKLTEKDVDTAMREVRMALLEADVALPVVKEFVRRVKEQAVGADVAKSLKPGQQVVKIVHDELLVMLGEPGRLNFSTSQKPHVIMMVGLQGSGKTTTTAKLALRMQKEQRQVRMIAADVYRPAAIDQLETLGTQLNVPVFARRDTKDVVQIVRDGLEVARRERDRIVFIDTAGRLQIDENLMDELKRVKEAVRPDEILLVADGMTGQDAVKIAEGFNTALGITGIILTKMDGDARGGAALSVYGATKKPIKYIGVGEKVDALEEFHPDRMAGRILQMGDVLSLVEKAQESFDADEAKKLEKKVRREGMDLNDFLGAMKQIEKLGPLEGILKMIPGVNTKALKQAKMDPKRMKHVEAIVLSMTMAERKKPELINGSRRLRIAKGSGRTVAEVNRLLDQFRDMQKMMKKVTAGGGRNPFGRF